MQIHKSRKWGIPRSKRMLAWIGSLLIVPLPTVAQNPPILPPPPPPPPVQSPIPPPFAPPTGGGSIIKPSSPTETTPSGDPLVPEKRRSQVEIDTISAETRLRRIGQIDRLLISGRWRKARKRTDDMLRDLLIHGGTEQVLRPMLAQISLFQALADAQQGLWRRAEWRFHTALNLVPEMVEQDLSPYGEPGAWLAGRSLRLQGSVLEDDDVLLVPPAGKGSRSKIPFIKPPRWHREIKPPEAFSRAGSPWRKIQPPQRAEIIVGRWGELSQPRVSAADLVHPMMIYLALEALWQSSPIEPARIDGKPRSILFDLELEIVLPWIRQANSRW